MHNNFWYEAEEDVFEQALGKPEACPIMPVLQGFQTIAIDLDLAIKVHIVEGHHWDLVSPAVLGLIGLILEGKVVLDGTSGKSGLFVFARSEHGVQSPKCDQDREGGEETKEDGGLESTADLPRKIERDETEKGEKEDVGESFSSGGICWKGGIFDGRELRNGSAELN